MNINPWSGSYAPEFAERIDSFIGFLYGANNGKMDIRGFLDSEYGWELGERLQQRFRIEDEPMGNQALTYYEKIGLRKEYFEGEDYFTRWTLCTPLEAFEEGGDGRLYPLVFWNHGGGNHIETFEVVSGLCEVAGREKFMVCMPQNTNWQNAKRILELLVEKYPVDPERVYTAGFSQGGYQTHSAYMHMPERFAAAAVAGAEIYRPYDNHDIWYTEDELRRVKQSPVPLFQMAGTCEPSAFIPLNDWSPRRTPLAGMKKGYPDTKEHLALNNDPARDPTRIQDSEGFVDPYFIRDGVKPTWRMNTPFKPAEDEDRHLWKLGLVDQRLNLLSCRPLDVKRCLDYLDAEDDLFHRILGVYGDRETVETWYGYRHYRADWDDLEGRNVLSYVAVENSPHWPPLMFGELAWDFLRRFRKDQKTGRLIMDGRT